MMGNAFDLDGMEIQLLLNYVAISICTMLIILIGYSTAGMNGVILSAVIWSIGWMIVEFLDSFFNELNTLGAAIMHSVLKSCPIWLPLWLVIGIMYLLPFT